MGRMLDALRQTNGKAARPVGPATPSLVSPALGAVFTDGTDDIPYIEVGGPASTMEASPSVLAAAKPSGSAPLTAPKSPRPPLPDVSASRRSNDLTIAFQPLPDIPPPLDLAGKRFARELVAYHQWDHPNGQQYRTLLEAINSQEPLAGPRVWILAGVASGAGTTTVSLNLAIACARQGQGPVAVVDGNFRKPAVARQLGLMGGATLADVLARRCPVGRALRETGQDNLFALVCGPADSVWQHGPALGLKAALRDLRRQCRYVVVDAPSWDGGPELAGLGSAADGVYLVLRPAEVGSPDVLALMQLLPQVGSDLAGYIVARG